MKTVNEVINHFENANDEIKIGINNIVVECMNLNNAKEFIILPNSLLKDIMAIKYNGLNNFLNEMTDFDFDYNQNHKFAKPFEGGYITTNELNKDSFVLPVEKMANIIINNFDKFNIFYR